MAGKCVNLSNPIFIELQLSLNVATESLETAIKLWMDKNNSDDFPTLGYLNQYYKRGLSTEYLTNQDLYEFFHALWEKNYKTPVIKSFYEANALTATLSKGFGKNSVRMDLTANDPNMYSVSVAEPTFTGNTTIEYKKDYTLLERLFNGKTDISIKNILKNIKDTNPELKPLVEVLEKLHLSSDYRVLLRDGETFISLGHKGSTGFHRRKSKLIFINSSSKYYTKSGVADFTVLHEIIHALTVTKLDSSEELLKVGLNILNDIIKLLEQYYGKSKEELLKLYNNLYGITNVKELLAESMNPRFIQLLKLLDATGNLKIKDNLFTRVLEWFRDLLEIKQNTAYDEVMLLLSDVIQYKPTGVSNFSTPNDIENNLEINIDMTNYTNHSGGAYGADTMWDYVGRLFGVTDHRHYRDEGNKSLSLKLRNTKVTATVLTKALMDEARTLLELLLGKKYADNLQGNLQVRNYYQVANADAVFAVAPLNESDMFNKGQVYGGTNTTVQLGIKLNKPVYLWNTSSENWMLYNPTTKQFEVTETPILTKNFAGVGTRNIENYNTLDKESGKWVSRKEYLGIEKEKAAIKAILDVYLKTYDNLASNQSIHTSTKSIITTTKENYSRQIVKNNPRTLYIFTDNTDRDSGSSIIPSDTAYSIKYGTGHHYPSMTTAMIRGMENSRPISTQRWYHTGAKGNAGRWLDADIEEFSSVIDDEINEIKKAWATGNYDNIIIPAGDGFFNSKISNISIERTPKLYNYLKTAWGNLEKEIINTTPRVSEQINEAQSLVDTILNLTTEVVKEGVESIFENNPELTNIGTPEQYSQYLNTIFPNSKVKDIVYHGTASKFDNFDKQYLSKYDVGYYGRGFYFSTKPNKNYSDKSYHKQEVDGVILPVLVNLPNPNYKASTDFSDTGKDIVKDKGVVVIDENLDNELTEKTKTPYEFVKALLKLGKYDIDQIVVSEPEQIHILGSKQDIEGFKVFKFKLDQAKLPVALRVLKVQMYEATSATDLQYLANQVMYNFSYVVSHLLTNKEANQAYLQDKFKDVDFTTMDRLHIIKMIGVNNIFNIVKELIFNKKVAASIRGIKDIKVLKKLGIAYDNFDALIKIGYSKFIILEDLSITGVEDITYDEADLVQSEIDTLDDNGGTRERFLMDVRTISVKASLSQAVRKVFEKLIELDINGNVVKDEYGLNKMIDSNLAINSILNWVRGSTSIELIETKLLELLEDNQWLVSILNNIKEEPFRSQFFSNFRKAFNYYGTIIWERDSNGVSSIKVHSVNTQESVTGFLDALKIKYAKNLLTDIVEDGTVNITKVSELAELAKSMAGVLSGSFSDRETFARNVESYIPFIKDLLNSFGLDIPTVAIKKTLLMKSGLDVKNYHNTAVHQIYSQLKYMFATLDVNKGVKNYDPLVKKKNGGNDLFNDYKKILAILAPNLSETILASTYNNGKMYYSYVNPSYLSDLINSLNNFNKNQEEFNNFIQENYKKYRYFYDPVSRTWYNSWLGTLVNSEDKVRSSLEHKIQLDYLGTPYTELNYINYSVALMREYFYDKNKKYAWFRVPILSNKNSNEFIKFNRISGTGYEGHINSDLVRTFNQEILRIRTVLLRSINPSISKIKNFDITDKYLSENPTILSKLQNEQPLTIEDLAILGKGSGGSFRFLTNFNKEIFTKTALGYMILDKINGKAVDEVSLLSKVLESIGKDINASFDIAVAKWKLKGLFNTIVDEKGNTVYKYLDFLGTTEKEITDNLKEYYYNDRLATLNIIQLATTDLAFFANTGDYQKRVASIHSDTLKGNIGVKMADGTPYSKDGISRTIYLKDEVVISEIKDNVKAIFDARLEDLQGNPNINEFRAIFSSILKGFDKVNVTDALAYSSPTGYRKRAAMYGEWNNTMEEAYQRLLTGNFNIHDLNILWQPKKPFVYTQIEKESGSDVLSNLKVPMTNKNSEYLLLLSDAIMRSGNKINKLSVIYDFMEDTAYNSKTENGVRTDYNGMGIDTVLFSSAVKPGEMGVIDINNAPTAEEVMRILHDASYTKDALGLLVYNPLNVHNIPYENYGKQQEIPNHFVDHSLAMPTLVRVLNMSDIDSKAKFIINGERFDKPQLVQEYLRLIADNIRIAHRKLVDTLKLDTNDIKQINAAVSKVLTDAIASDLKYGPEMLRACSLDDYGDFIIPLNDPIHADRIQKLLNSIIKSRINKLKISGGPVVQVTSYGLSEDLNVIFKNSKGELLKTRKLFESSTNEEATYLEYVKKHQDSVAYFECYLPAYSKSLFEDLIDKNGNLNMNKKNPDGSYILPSNLRDAIASRIPTEDKYSMIPIRIKGFMPESAGDGIMLPKDITLLAGVDFDVDKLYIELYSFIRKALIDYKSAWREFKKTSAFEEYKVDKLLEDAIKSSNFAALDSFFSGDGIDAKQVMLDSFKAFIKNNKSKFYNVNYEKLDSSNAEKGSEVEVNTNRIMDLQRAVLTHRDTAIKMFNPGSFDTVKKVARIIVLLNSNTNENVTYDSLNKLSLEQLDAMVGSLDDMNILDPTTQSYLFELNMTSGDLVGIFATNNTSHAFISLLNIAFKMKPSEAFILNGINVSTRKLDDVNDIKGGFISKTLASLLAASVDAVKDPVLNFLNLSALTAGPAVTLARLGYSVDTIGLLLTQPIILKLSLEYFQASADGNTSVDLVIDRLIKELNTDNIGIDKLFETSAKTNISNALLANNIVKYSKGDINSQEQLEILILYKKIQGLSSKLSDLTFITKFNSTANAVGPTVADTLLLQIKYQKFMDNMNSKNPSFTAEAVNILDDTPILKAFFETTVGKDGISNQLFSHYFSYYTELFKLVLDELINTSKGSVNAEDINGLYNFYMAYKMTLGDNPVINTDAATRRYYINEFPSKYLSLVEGIEGNKLIDSIVVIPSNHRCPVEALALKLGRYDSELTSDIKNAWSDLIRNPETKLLGIDLIKYNFFRSGFNFSPKTFMHMASVAVKLSLEGYIEAVKDVSYNDDLVLSYEVLSQYRRNNSHNRRLVPLLVKSKELEINENSEGITIKVSKILNAYRSIIVRNGKDKVYAPYIMYKDSLYSLEDADDLTISYSRAPVLGNKNNFIEVNGNETAYTVIPKDSDAFDDMFVGADEIDFSSYGAYQGTSNYHESEIHSKSDSVEDGLLADALYSELGIITTSETIADILENVFTKELREAVVNTAGSMSRAEKFVSIASEYYSGTIKQSLIAAKIDNVIKNLC